MSDFKHVVQPSAKTCAHACLSMVTGVSVFDIIDHFQSKDGLTLQQQHDWLCQQGWTLEYFKPLAKYDFPYEGLYIVSVPSLNCLGRTHRIVVIVDWSSDNDWNVYDPNEGRGSKNYYTRDAIRKGTCSFSESTFVRKVSNHVSK